VVQSELLHAGVLQVGQDLGQLLGAVIRWAEDDDVFEDGQFEPEEGGRAEGD